MSTEDELLKLTESADQNEMTTTVKVIQAKAFVEEATKGATSTRTEFKPPPASWSQRLFRWLRRV